MLFDFSMNHFSRLNKFFILSCIGITLPLLTGFIWMNYLQPPVATITNENSKPITTVLQPAQPVVENSETPYKLEMVADNLSVPWSIVFTSPERMLVTERSGKIRGVENGILVKEDLISFPEVSSKSEEGLMGLTLDPQYESNKYLYTSLAYSKNGSLIVKILRLIDEQEKIIVDKIILDDIPAATNHAGNRLKFGPDNKLYSTTGDATDRAIAQKKDSLGGKILRINVDGSIPTDNPFPNSYIYSWGHRNPQGIAWHPVTNELYQTEHGPSTFDGPPGGDEVNRIVKGGNYGWPIVSHQKSKEGLISPLVTYTPAVAPASAMIYSGKIFPQFTHNLFFGGLIGTGVYRVVLDPKNPDGLLSQEKLPDINVGRIRDVVEGPDGYIYFSTSNRDRRGKPNENDDKVYRLVPR